MSDPVPNAEIEDVLSSIRRLVSVGDRSAKSTAEPEEDKADKLVLTPALRVDEADAPATPQDDAPDADDQAADMAEMVEDESDSGDWAMDTDEPAAPEDVWQGSQDAPETADDLDADDDSYTPGWADDEIADDPAEPHDAAPPEAATQEADEDEHAADDGPGRDVDQGADEGLSLRAADFEDAVAARDDQWEPDGDSDDDNAARPLTSLPWQDYEPDATGQPAPAGAADEYEGLEPFQPEDDLETYEPEPEPAPARDDNAFLSEPDPLGPNEAIMDEDALRDLVAEIVREELQGSLGERITRNVRKLVRREIQRALAAQELE